MQPLFRKARPDDAPAMDQLLILAWKKAYRGILSDALLDARDPNTDGQRLRQAIETKADFQYYVLEHNQTINGVLVLTTSSDNDLPEATAIQVFYIHPDFQRQGLGRILMRHTLEVLQAEAPEAIILWVLKDNRSARAFYEAMGFTADGTEKLLERLENVPAVRYRYTGDQ